MFERGISEKEVEMTIIKGSKNIQGGKIIASYSNLIVIYKKVAEVNYVITVMERW